MRTSFGLGPFLAAMLLVAIAPGCRSAYYAAWEQFGKHKRDLLKDNVEQVRDDQKAASEEFKDALTRLKELYRFEGGELDTKYNQLSKDFERCQTRAKTVRDRIQKVEEIASDLFQEWDTEIKSISNPRLRDDSRAKLQETRRKFESLKTAMKRAEQSMEPALGQFKDQVLYLKHNLNAQAVGALKTEALDIEREVQQLIRDMNASIAQADAFIKAMP